MTNFEDLKSQWDNQPKSKVPIDGSKQIIKRIHFIKQKQRITNMVLGITAIVIISFFVYIKAYRNAIVTTALLLMIVSLLSRILIENVSRRKFKNMNVTLDAETFKQKMIAYYKKRMKIHYLITPVIAALYIVGFIMLLPFFKEELSNGFYLYIKVSAVAVFVSLTVFIRKEVLKELKILKELSM